MVSWPISVLTSGAGHICTPLACASNPVESSRAAIRQGRDVELTRPGFSSGATSASLPIDPNPPRSLRMSATQRRNIVPP
jgi:hypothetical protein